MTAGDWNAVGAGRQLMRLPGPREAPGALRAAGALTHGVGSAGSLDRPGASSMHRGEGGIFSGSKSRRQ
jgi:hypothetical protein